MNGMEREAKSLVVNYLIIMILIGILCFLYHGVRFFFLEIHLLFL